MESLFIAFILTMIVTVTFHPPVSFLLTPLGSTSPSPSGRGSLFFGKGEVGER